MTLLCSCLHPRSLWVRSVLWRRQMAIEVGKAFFPPDSLWC